MKEQRQYRWICYGILCPNSQAIKYVGISCDPKGRLIAHRRAARRGERTAFYDWLRDIIATGKSPKLVELQSGTGMESASDAERHWIEVHAGSGQLLNRNPGGVDWNPEAFRKSLHYQSRANGAEPKRVRCLTTNVVYDSIRECARALNIDDSRVHQSLKKGYRCCGRQLTFEGMDPVKTPRDYKSRRGPTTLGMRREPGGLPPVRLGT